MHNNQIRYQLSKKETDNKRLVQILNSKIFKGYRQIRAAKTYGKNDLKYVKLPTWEIEELEPFEDNYNLQYKQKYLNSIEAPLSYNPFLIDNLANSNNKESKGMALRAKIKRKQSKKIRTTSFKEKLSLPFFAMTETSGFAYNDKYNDREKKVKVFKELFKHNEDEFNYYSVLPFFIMEKKINVEVNSSRRPYNNTLSTAPNEQEIQRYTNDIDEYSHLNQPQFLFKISREKRPIYNTRLYTASNGLRKGFAMKQTTPSLTTATGLNGYRQITVKVTRGNTDSSNFLTFNNISTKEKKRIIISALPKNNKQKGSILVSTQIDTEKNKECCNNKTTNITEAKYCTDQLSTTTNKLKTQTS